MPKNARGWDVDQTFEHVESSGKLSPKAANYKSKTSEPSESCGACRFFLRAPKEHMGACQVVSGSIDPFGYSDLYVSAAKEIESLLSKPTDSPYSKKNRYSR